MFLAIEGPVKILNIKYIRNVFNDMIQIFSFKYRSGSIIENLMQTNVYFI